MSTPKKIALGLILFFIALVIVLVIVVPKLVDVDRYRPQVIAHIQEETGKPAEIGHLALRVFPAVSIRVDDFALRNPAGFPAGYFLKTRRIYAAVDARALWHRQVLIKSLELDDPVINLLSDVRGKWNFENPPKPKTPATASAGLAASFTLGVIPKVTMARGQLTAANLLPSGRPGPTFFEARGISSELEQVDLNAFVVPASASSAPRPASWPVAHQAGWGTSLLVFAAPANPNPAAQGVLKADMLRFGALQATAVKCKLRLFAKQVFFDDLNLKLYGGNALGNLALNLAGQNLRYSANARLSGVDVAKLLAAFPDARGKMTGKMDGSSKLSGEVTHSPDPLAGMRGSGQLSVRNGQLPSLQLNKNLTLLARLTKLGPAEGDPSSFSSIFADFNIANQRISSNKVTIVGNGVDMDAAGSLTLAGAGSLEYDGVAKVVAGQNPVTNLFAGLSGATFADGKLTFPFTIGGTLQEPKFSLKSAGGAGHLGELQNVLAGGQQPTTQPSQTEPQTPADLVQGITGLFKKKQPAQQPPSQPSSQPQP